VQIEIAETGAQPALVDSLLRSLPAWFGIEESIQEYVEAAHRLPTLVARTQAGVPVGVLLYERHFPETAEIHLMAVDPKLHRTGVGRALVQRVEQAVVADSARLLSVKTLGPSRADPNYDRTRLFYTACGFVPVEEFLDLWPGNPCLLMIKCLDGHQV
jgi:GNAT superfamily N-acetyltransferase